MPAPPTPPEALFPIETEVGPGFIDGSGRVALEPERLRDALEKLLPTQQRMTPLARSRMDYSIGPFSEGLARFSLATCPGCRNPAPIHGFIDAAGRVAIPPIHRYRSFGRFSEGLAAFREGQTTGFVDRAGNEAIPRRFYEAAPFSEGLSRVRRHALGKEGFIDKKGRSAIPCRFDEARDFREGLAAVRDEVSRDQKYPGHREERWGFIDRSGQWVIPPTLLFANAFSEGKAAVRQSRDDHGFGYVDRRGTLVIPNRFEKAGLFSEGRAAVAVAAPDGGLALWGFIDETGAWVVPPTYRGVTPFSGGLAGVGCDDYGRACKAYVDRAGKVVWGTP